MRPKPFSGPWATLALLWIAFALNYIDRQIAYSIFPALRHDLAFSQLQLGLIGTVFLWTYAVSMLPAGRAADLFSRRRLILASLGLWSVATAGCGLASSPALFLFWRAVIAVSEALYSPAALGLIATLHPSQAHEPPGAAPADKELTRSAASGGVNVRVQKSTRSTALSIHVTAQVAGAVAGGWYGGWAADRIGWRPGFLAIAFAGLAYAAALTFLLADAPSVPDAPRSQPTGFRALLRSPSYLALCGAFFPFCATIWMFYTWLPDLLYTRHGLSMERAGLIATAGLQLASAIGVLAGGRLADRLALSIPPARLYVAAAGAVLSPAFFYLVFTTPSVARVQLFSIAFGLTAGLMMGNVFPAGYDALPAGAYGVGAGVVNACGGLGGGLCVLLAGLLRGPGQASGVSPTGLGPLSAVTAALTAAAGLAMFLVVRSQYRPLPAPAPCESPSSR